MGLYVLMGQSSGRDVLEEFCWIQIAVKIFFNETCPRVPADVFAVDFTGTLLSGNFHSACLLFVWYVYANYSINFIAMGIPQIYSAAVRIDGIPVCPCEACVLGGGSGSSIYT